MSDLKNKLKAIAEKHGIDISPKSFAEIQADIALIKVAISKVTMAEAVLKAMGIEARGFDALIRLKEVTYAKS